MSRDAFCFGTKDHRNGRNGLNRLLLIQPGGNRFMLKAWALGSGQPTCVTTGKSVNSPGLSFLTCKSLLQEAVVALKAMCPYLSTWEVHTKREPAGFFLLLTVAESPGGLACLREAYTQWTESPSCCPGPRHAEER